MCACGAANRLWLRPRARPTWGGPSRRRESAGEGPATTCCSGLSAAPGLPIGTGSRRAKPLSRHPLAPTNLHSRQRCEPDIDDGQRPWRRPGSWGVRACRRPRPRRGAAPPPQGCGPASAPKAPCVRSPTSQRRTARPPDDGRGLVATASPGGVRGGSSRTARHPGPSTPRSDGDLGDCVPHLSCIRPRMAVTLCRFRPLPRPWKPLEQGPPTLPLDLSRVRTQVQGRAGQGYGPNESTAFGQRLDGSQTLL
ncbi:MAG: hypothetical protein JWN68_855 [Nocardioides sp.]|nr:hypothetical protein [Nocardioides sp.]